MSEVEKGSSIYKGFDIFNGGEGGDSFFGDIPYMMFFGYYQKSKIAEINNNVVRFLSGCVGMYYGGVYDSGCEVAEFNTFIRKTKWSGYLYTNAFYINKQYDLSPSANTVFSLERRSNNFFYLRQEVVGGGTDEFQIDNTKLNDDIFELGAEIKIRVAKSSKNIQLYVNNELVLSQTLSNTPVLDVITINFGLYITYINYGGCYTNGDEIELNKTYLLMDGIRVL